MTLLNLEFSLLFLSYGNVCSSVLREGQRNEEKSAIMKSIFIAEEWPHCFLRQQRRRAGSPADLLEAAPSHGTAGPEEGYIDIPKCFCFCFFNYVVSHTTAWIRAMSGRNFVKEDTSAQGVMVLYSSLLQPFWHQGPVSWKTVFSHGLGQGMGWWFPDDSNT